MSNVKTVQDILFGDNALAGDKYTNGIVIWTVSGPNASGDGFKWLKGPPSRESMSVFQDLGPHVVIPGLRRMCAPCSGKQLEQIDE